MYAHQGTDVASACGKNRCNVGFVQFKHFVKRQKNSA